MKTSELTDLALNGAVAKCELGADAEQAGDWWEPSTNWAQGGPIIEREKISIEWTGEDWMTYIRHDEECFGPTPLIAAMRCFVASKMGDNIDIPEEMK